MGPNTHFKTLRPKKIVMFPTGRVGKTRVGKTRSDAFSFFLFFFLNHCSWWTFNMFMFMPTSADPTGRCSPSSTLMHVPTQRGPEAAHRPSGRKLSPPSFVYVYVSAQVPWCHFKVQRGEDSTGLSWMCIEVLLSKLIVCFQAFLHCAKVCHPNLNPDLVSPWPKINKFFKFFSVAVNCLTETALQFPRYFNWKE